MMTLCFSLGRMFLGCSSPSFTLIIQATIARLSLDGTFFIATVDHYDRFLLEPYCSDFRSKPETFPGLSLQLIYFDFANYAVLSAIPFLLYLIIMQFLKANLNYFQIRMLLVVRWLLVPALQQVEEQS